MAWVSVSRWNLLDSGSGTGRSTVQQETQFYRSLFDEAPLPYQSLDSEGRLLTVNRAWQEELLFDKHEVLGRWFGDFVCSDQKAVFRERFAQFVEEGRAQGVMWSLIRKDGSTVSVSFSGRIERDEAGRLRRANCIFFDLAKRSEEEEQLRESEELRMAFMESAGEGFGIFNADLRLIYINQVGAALFDATPENLTGRLMTDISPGTVQTERYAQFRRVLETGEPFSIDEYTPPAQLRDRRFAVSAFKVGEDLGIILRDVTHAKLSEQRLHESEAKWRALTEESPDHVILLSRDLRIEYVNTPLHGFTSEQMIGDYICQHSGDSDQQRIRDTLERVLSSGEAASYVTKYVAPDGETIWFESRAVARVVDGKTDGLTVSVRDISQRMVDQTRIAQLLKRQTAMAQLSIDFGGAETTLDVFRTSYQHISELMASDVYIVSRYSAAEASIYTEYAKNGGCELDTSGMPPIPLEPEGRGIQSKVIREGKPMIVPDYHEAMSTMGTRYKLSANGRDAERLSPAEAVVDLPRSALIVPMKIRGEVFGIVQVQSNALEAYTSEDAELLSGLASITAGAIENRSLIGKLQETYEGVIRALAKAIELRDPYTSAHQEGVARIAVGIAEAMGLSTDQCQSVELAAHVHDIGKIVIPAEILSKPSQLTKAEMLIVQSHVEAAHNVLADVVLPWPIADIVGQHHERLDGSGYPNGIHADQMRVEARILAVADIADAMLSHRPYRPAVSLEDTVSELRRLSGIAFDSSVVEACLVVLERERLADQIVI